MLSNIYLEASLFFSFLDLGLAVKGSSLTGVRSLITLFSFLSSLPICRSFLGLGVRSSTSVLRDFFAAYFPVLNMQKIGLGSDTICTQTCEKKFLNFFFGCSLSCVVHYKRMDWNHVIPMAFHNRKSISRQTALYNSYYIQFR